VLGMRRGILELLGVLLLTLLMSAGSEILAA
jgi:hypothetical protein